MQTNENENQKKDLPDTLILENTLKEKNCHMGLGRSFCNEKGSLRQEDITINIYDSNIDAPKNIK
jgi:hypothetical protein